MVKQKKMILNDEMDVKEKASILIMCTAHQMEAQTVKSLKDFGLSRTQLCILQALVHSNEPLTVNQLKDLMVDNSPNVSRSLNKLMENGYVTKERDNTDQRVVKIHVTQQGIQVHHEADAARLEKDWDSDLSQSEFELLVDLLQRI